MVFVLFHFVCKRPYRSHLFWSSKNTQCYRFPLIPRETARLENANAAKETQSRFNLPMHPAKNHLSPLFCAFVSSVEWVT